MSKPRTPESLWRSFGMKWLRARFGQYMWEYRTVGNGMTRSGVPDDLLLIRGVFVAIEWKRPEYKPRGTWTAQDQEISRIIECGGRAAKIKNMDELMELVSGIETKGG